jgi:hypothetical protein
MLLLPVFPNSKNESIVVQTMIPDLKIGILPSEIKTIFCSQVFF